MYYVCRWLIQKSWDLIEFWWCYASFQFRPPLIWALFAEICLCFSTMQGHTVLRLVWYVPPLPPNHLLHPPWHAHIELLNIPHINLIPLFLQSLPQFVLRCRLNTPLGKSTGQMVPNVLDGVDIGALGRPGEENDAFLRKPSLSCLRIMLRIIVLLKDDVPPANPILPQSPQKRLREYLDKLVAVQSSLDAMKFANTLWCNALHWNSQSNIEIYRIYNTKKRSVLWAPSPRPPPLGSLYLQHTMP